MTTTAAITPRLTIPEVVRVYEAACAEIRESFARLSETQDRLNATFTLGHCTSIHVNARVDFGDPEREIVRIRHDVWACILAKLEVRRLLSIARWRELELQLERHELPEITERSVAELVRGFETHLPEMLAEAVEEVFAWLRPARSEYKRNSELEVPERVVLTGIVERWDKFRTSWKVNYHREQNLIALENVFSALAGAGVVAKQHYSAISNTIHAKGFDGAGETEHFRFRAFRNSNLHLQFRRLDLLARFNSIAGGRRLRPASKGAA